MENGLLMGAVFIDLKKALDTVPHNGLLNKLFRYGIQDQPLSWFESCLRESSPPCTPWGRYCWTRLLFGISSVPEEFQQRPHDELYGVEGVVNIADDIIVIGQGESLGDATQDHDCTVLHLLNCLKMVGCYINSSRHYLRGRVMTRSQLEQI